MCRVSRSVWAGAAVLGVAVALVLCPGQARSVAYWWDPIAESDLIVVGVVGAPEAYDAALRDRVSVLAVSHVLHGDVGEQDTLRVHWSASFVVVRPGYAVGTVGWGPELAGEIVDTPALWMLRRSSDESLRMTRAPIMLGRGARAELEAVVSRSGSLATLRRSESTEVESGTAEKIRALNLYIAGYMDGLLHDDDANGETRRSN